MDRRFAVAVRSREGSGGVIAGALFWMRPLGR